MKKKVKFIRGVKGRGADVKRTILGWRVTESCIDAGYFANENYLFFVDEDNYYGQKADTPLGELILEHGEEVFLEPEYKFKVGDTVTPVGNTAPSIYGKITECVNDKGNPYYRVSGLYMLGKYPEAKLELSAKRIKTWDDLIGGPLEGYYIWSMDSKIRDYETEEVDADNRDVAASEKVAKSMLAMAQISQLMPYYGGEITDEEWDNDMIKHVIIRTPREIKINFTKYLYYFLAFHTKEQAEEFLANNEQLVRDYLMIN